MLDISAIVWLNISKLIQHKFWNKWCLKGSARNEKEKYVSVLRKEYEQKSGMDHVLSVCNIYVPEHVHTVKHVYHLAPLYCGVPLTSCAAYVRVCVFAT